MVGESALFLSLISLERIVNFLYQQNNNIYISNYGGNRLWTEARYFSATLHRPFSLTKENGTSR